MISTAAPGVEAVNLLPAVVGGNVSFFVGYGINRTEVVFQYVVHFAVFRCIISYENGAQPAAAADVMQPALLPPCIGFYFVAASDKCFKFHQFVVHYQPPCLKPYMPALRVADPSQSKPAKSGSITHPSKINIFLLKNRMLGKHALQMRGS